MKKKLKPTTMIGFISVLLLTCGLAVFAIVSPFDIGQKSKATFVGSQKCVSCHADVAKKHAAGPHGSLTDAAPDGSRGCESCHGPGSEHAAGDKSAIINPTNLKQWDADQNCLKCHGIVSGSTYQTKSKKLPEKSWMRGKHPTKGISCNSCHSEHGGGDHQLKKAANVLCASCHADVKPKPGEFDHPATAAGDCMQCHEAHASRLPGLARDNVDSICANCHDSADAVFSKAHSNIQTAGARCTSCHTPHLKDKATRGLPITQHKPFANRQCSICHGPTPATPPAALIKPGNDVCLKCHSTVANVGKLTSGTTHPPFKQGLCVSCHNPHVSKKQKQPLLKASVERTCLVCHSAIDTARNGRVKHTPVEQGSCLTCHSGHHTNEEKLLTKPALDVCERCHPKEHSNTHPVGFKMVGNVKKMLLDPRNGKMLTCQSCHTVHGGKHEFLTTADWQRDLCIQCHKTGQHVK